MEMKKKNLGAPRLGSIPFVVIWMIIHIVVWVTLFMLSEMGFQYDNEILSLILFGLIMGFGLALVPKLLIRYAYRDMLKGWMRITIMGWVAGWFVFYHAFEVLEDLPGFLDDNLSVMLLPLFVIPAALQWFVLRHHTRQAWLWIVAGAVSAMAFGALYGDIRGEELWQFILGASAQGAVTGLTLLWLYGQSRTEKIKSGVSGGNA